MVLVSLAIMWNRAIELHYRNVAGQVLDHGDQELALACGEAVVVVRLVFSHVVVLIACVYETFLGLRYVVSVRGNTQEFNVDCAI